MKYIKYFNEDAEYQQFKETDEYILPNVSYVENSDVVYYNPFVVPKLVCTYNVTGTTSVTKLCRYVTGFTSMEIDGVMMDNVATGFTFNTIGEHTVKFELADPTTIGDSEFSSCTSLTSVVIPNSVTSIGSMAFYNCTGLISVVIPDSVTKIKEWIFYNCSGLTSVVIPDSVTEIGDRAFYGCSGLTSVKIGSGVTTIPDSVFNYCSGLETIVVKEGNPNYDSRENCNCIIETSTNTLIKGCNNSFIPDSVTSIGNYAFNGCTGLTGELVIPNLVTSIGDYAFSACTNLTLVEIGSGVTKIGDTAFYHCYGLTSVVIPDSVTSIGSMAFDGCTGLTGELVIGSGVTSINNYAFNDCSGLTSVTIGSGVTTIGNYTFKNCSSLTEIVCHASIAPTIQKATFQNIKRSGVLKVPVGSNYSTWMSTSNYYLGYYNWTTENI